jgi:ABC-type transport system involved in multi-copper enzyme maturation permease subunit
MLTRIAAFEWRYATRRITFAAAAAGFALLGFVLGSTGFGADDIPVNAPYAIAYSIAFLSLTSVFALTVIVAPSLLRDREHQMEEIVYATAVTKTEYLIGRLAGSFAAAGAAFCFGVAGMIAGALRHEPERLMPFAAGPYLQATVVLALPTMLFVASLLFAIAAFTRSALATYVGGVAVYVLYFASAVLTGSPLLAQSRPTTAEELAAAALADPFAIAAFFEQTHYWTAAERGVRAVALTGNLRLNRGLWTTAALIVIALAHGRFAFRLAAEGRGAAVEPEGPVASAAAAPPPAIAPSAWRAALSATRLEARALARSWPFAAVLLLWVAAAAMQVHENVGRAEFGTALLPATGLVLRAVERALLFFGLVVIVYFSGEIVWRERSARVAEIVDATPASSAAFLASKVAASWLVAAAMIAAAIAVGVALQVAGGYRPIRPGLHASLFYFAGMPLALFAVLAVALQTLAPHRYVGMLLAAAAAAYPLGVPVAPEHPLLRYAAGPDVPHSEMNGFGPAAGVFTAVMAYWTAVAGALLLVAGGAWRRGTDTRLRRRLRALPRRLGRGGRLALLASVVAAAVIGGVLGRQMAANGYESAGDNASRRVAYERTYAATAAPPMPRIAHVAATVDLFPEQRRYRIRGAYRLENHTPATIASVPVTIRRGVRADALTLDGRPATTIDPRFGLHTFAVALLPGAHAELAFDIAVERHGAAAEVVHDVVENGSLVVGPSVLPAIGYQRGIEIADPDERRRQGLPPQAPAPVRPPDLATFDFTVTTPAGQTAVAPGVVREAREEGGRRTIRTAVDHPVSPHLFVAAARYAVARARAGGVGISVLHHPPHAANVPRILEAAARSLEYFAREFGPYPFPELRIAEVPSYQERFAGFALPGVVFFTEDRGFLTDRRDPRRVDIVTKRTAHEVAHQWWGHQVSPAAAPGASAIVETLARYSELMILKETHGEAALRPVLQEERRRYLSGRTGEAEVPLDRVEDQAYLYYAKGALAMAALRDVIGEARVNGALRALVAQSAAGDTPDVADLVAHLREATPPAHHALLDEWWRRTVLYDLTVVSARATETAGGRRVDARIGASRTGVEGGRETPLPMDATVEVAVYASHPDRSDAPPLHVARVALRGQTTDVSFVVGGRPGYVVVDPHVRVIDRNPDDNARAIEPAMR